MLHSLAGTATALLAVLCYCLPQSASSSRAAPALLESLSTKEITYVRHGKSTGNAGIWGALFNGSPTAYRDGILMPDGEKQVADRVGFLGDALLSRMLAAEAVLTSPLRRAMGTTILLLGHLHHQRLHQAQRLPGADNTTSCVALSEAHRWPPVQVVAEMREKVKSYSEVPGSGDSADPMEYVRDMGKKVGRDLFCDERAMDLLVQAIEESYVAEAKRTQSWTVHWDNVPEPTDGWTFLQMIEAFKRRVLAQRSEGRLLLVGHSGWSKFAFAHLLPGPPSSGSSRHQHLVVGARRLNGLNNVGVLCTKFEGNIFKVDENFRVDGKGVTPGSPKFPNFDKKVREVILGFTADALAARVLPDDAQVRLFSMQKLGDYSRMLKKRIVALSAMPSLNLSYYSWFDEWGSPRGHMELSQGRTRITPHREKLSFTVSGETRESELVAHSLDNFEEFAWQIRQFTNPSALVDVGPGALLAFANSGSSPAGEGLASRGWLATLSSPWRRAR